LKPAQANSSVRPYLKKTLHKKRTGRVAEGPEFKPQYCKKKKKKKRERDNGSNTSKMFKYMSL
jgi:DNA-binding transcriptional regulator PaaX